MDAVAGLAIVLFMLLVALLRPPQTPEPVVIYVAPLPEPEPPRWGCLVAAVLVIVLLLALGAV